MNTEITRYFMVWYDGCRSLHLYRFSDSAVLISLFKKKNYSSVQSTNVQLAWLENYFAGCIIRKIIVVERDNQK